MNDRVGLELVVAATGIVVTINLTFCFDPDTVWAFQIYKSHLEKVWGFLQLESKMTPFRMMAPIDLAFKK